MSDSIDWILEDEEGHVIDKSEDRKRKEGDEMERLMDDYYDDWPDDLEIEDAECDRIMKDIINDLIQ